MELESMKYKNRLIIIAVILLISVILGTIAEKSVKDEARQVDEIVEVIQGTTEEEYNAVMQEKENSGENVSKTATKQEALNTFQEIQKFYDNIYKNSESAVILMFTFAISGSIIAIMMYFLFFGWIIKRVWPDIKKWLSVFMRILILIIAIPIPAVYYILITIGVFGQIPYVAFTLYKYIKTKKTEDTDDVIIEK
ncbi:MAG: hypothetical protein J6K45_02865 [Clostridia bacterium]|nr:hypothetical protein [Clostridia bacterium]